MTVTDNNYQLLAERFRHASKIKQLEDKIRELSESNARLQIALEQEQRESQYELNQANARADRRVEQAIEARNVWFKDMVMSFDQGCTDGKMQFLKHCGISLPDRRYHITMAVDVPYDTDIYSMTRDLENLAARDYDANYASGDYENCGLADEY